MVSIHFLFDNCTNIWVLNILNCNNIKYLRSKNFYFQPSLLSGVSKSDL